MKVLCERHGTLYWKLFQGILVSRLSLSIFVRWVDSSILFTPTTTYPMNELEKQAISIEQSNINHVNLYLHIFRFIKTCQLSVVMS